MTDIMLLSEQSEKLELCRNQQQQLVPTMYLTCHEFHAFFFSKFFVYFFPIVNPIGKCMEKHHP